MRSGSVLRYENGWETGRKCRRRKVFRRLRAAKEGWVRDGVVQTARRSDLRFKQSRATECPVEAGPSRLLHRTCFATYRSQAQQ